MFPGASHHLANLAHRNQYHQLKCKWCWVSSWTLSLGFWASGGSLILLWPKRCCSFSLLLRNAHQTAPQIPCSKQSLAKHKASSPHNPAGQQRAGTSSGQTDKLVKHIGYTCKKGIRKSVDTKNGMFFLCARMSFSLSQINWKTNISITTDSHGVFSFCCWATWARHSNCSSSPATSINPQKPSRCHHLPCPCRRCYPGNPSPKNGDNIG